MPWPAMSHPTVLPAHPTLLAVQTVENVLRSCLAQFGRAMQVLQHDASHLLTVHLAEGLLGARRSLPHDVVTGALRLVFGVRK